MFYSYSKIYNKINLEKTVKTAKYLGGGLSYIEERGDYRTKMQMTADKLQS